MGSRTKSKLGWLIAPIFVVGYGLTFQSLERFAVEYFVLTLVSLAACVLLLSQITRTGSRTLPIWVLLILFVVAYYVQFYQAVLTPNITQFLGPYQRGQGEHSADTFLGAYAISTCGFSSFCVIAWLYLASRSSGNSLRSSSYLPSTQSLAIALIVALILTVTTSAIMYKYQVVMGMESPQLPFHMAGVVLDTRLFAVPILLLWVIFGGMQRAARPWVIAGIAALVFEALLDMFVRASKGTLPTMLIMLGFMWLMAGWRISKKMIAIGGVLLIASALLFQVFATLRSLNYQGLPLQAAPDFLRYERASGFLGPSQLANLILLRLNGAAVLIVIAESGLKPLGLELLSLRDGFTSYVTFDVFAAYPEMAGRLYMSPSLMGCLYLLGGFLGVAAGMALVTGLVLAIWDVLPRLRIKTIHVAQAAFLLVVLTEANDGDLPTAGKQILFAAAVLVCVEVLAARLPNLRPRSTSAAQSH